MNSIQTITSTSGNYVANIYPDEPYNSPRDFDNLGRVVSTVRNYISNDKCNVYATDYESSVELEAAIRKQYDIAIIIPFYAYIHSGIKLGLEPFGCRWDSGLAGFIFATKEDIRNNFGVKNVTQKLINHTKDILESEIKELDQYLTGDVYGYEIIDVRTEEHIESCWGFYGIDYVEEEVNQILNRIDKDLFTQAA